MLLLLQADPFNLQMTLFRQLESMADFLPNLLIAIVILFIGWIIARLVKKVVARVLNAIGIDKLAERLNSVELFSDNNIRIIPSQLLGSIFYYVLMLVFMMASVDALQMSAVSELMTNFINYMPKAIAAFFVFIIGVFICDAVKKIAATAFESLGVRSGRFLANIVFYFLFLNIVLIAMQQAEVQTGFMENNISIVLGGVLLAFSIGYGLASRPLMANMLASFYSRDRFQAGDEMTVAGKRGKVINVDNTTLTLRVDEDEVVIPLSKLSTEEYIVHNRQAFIPLDEGEKE